MWKAASFWGMFFLCSHLSCHASAQSSFDCAIEIFMESVVNEDETITRTVSCGLAYDVLDVSIAEISLLTVESCGDVSTYHPLAQIDSFTPQPLLMSTDTTLVVSGIIDKTDDAKSFITVSQNVTSVSAVDLKTYRCVVVGLNSQGQTVSASDSVKDRIPRMVKDHNNDEELTDMISVAVVNISHQVANITHQLEGYNITDSFQEHINDIQGVGVKVNGISTDVATLASNASDKMEQLNTETSGKINTIHGIVEDYKANDTLQCSRKEVIDILKELNVNVSSEFNSISQTVESVKNAGVAQNENFTSYVETFSVQMTTSDTTNEVNELNGKLVTLDTALKGSNDKISVLDTSISGLNGNIGLLDTSARGLDASLGSLDTNLNGVETKTVVLDGKVNGLGDNVEIMGTKLGELDEKTITLHTKTNDVSEKTTLLNTAVDGLDAKVAVLDTKLVGLDGKAVSLNSEVAKLDEKLVILDTEVSGLGGKVESVDTQVTGLGDKVGALEAKVTGVDSKMIMLDTTAKEVDGMFETLDTTVKANGGKIDSLGASIVNMQAEIQKINSGMSVLENLDKNLDQLSLSLPTWTNYFAFSPFYTPSDEYRFRDKLYLLTRHKQTFDIYAANRVCQSYGGYLVEFEDEEEYQFINKTVMAKYPADPYYFTGYHDLDEEGKFVHVNSGNAMTLTKWRSDQPNSYNGNQDCVELYGQGTGLNDEDCDFSSRYICEVEFPF